MWWIIINLINHEQKLNVFYWFSPSQAQRLQRPVKGHNFGHQIGAIFRPACLLYFIAGNRSVLMLLRRANKSILDESRAAKS